MELQVWEKWCWDPEFTFLNITKLGWRVLTQVWTLLEWFMRRKEETWMVLKTYLSICVCVYKCVYVCICTNASVHGMHVEARGQLVGVSSLLSSCGFWGSNSGCQAWKKIPLLPYQSCRPLYVFINQKTWFIEVTIASARDLGNLFLYVRMARAYRNGNLSSQYASNLEELCIVWSLINSLFILRQGLVD